MAPFELIKQVDATNNATSADKCISQCSVARATTLTSYIESVIIIGLVIIVGSVIIVIACIGNNDDQWPLFSYCLMYICICITCCVGVVAHIGHIEHIEHIAPRSNQSSVDGCKTRTRTRTPTTR